MQNSKSVKIEKFKHEKKYKTKTDKEIKEIARGIYKNEIFSSMQIQENDSGLIMMVFMPLAFLSPIDRKQLILDEIYHFYGDLSNASPRSINGYPCLFNMNKLDKYDAEKVIIEYNKILKVLGDIDDG